MCSMVSSGFDGFSMLYFNILGYYEVSRNFVVMGGCCGKIRKSRTGLIDFEKGMIMWKKKKGQILADGVATVGGELLRQKALGGFIVIINTGPEGWNIGHLHF